MAYRWNGFECDTLNELDRLKHRYPYEKRARRFNTDEEHEDRCQRYPRRLQRCVLESGHDGLCDL